VEGIDEAIPLTNREEGGCDLAKGDRSKSWWMQAMLIPPPFVIHWQKY